MKRFSLPFLIGGMMFVLASCTNGATTETTTNSGTPGSLTTQSSLTHDWGKINIQGGKVSNTFTLTNTGEGPVTFSTASTSCMCTTADITLSDGSRSPQFGMHGKKTWGKSIAPGEEANITVTFDPMAHGPKATGPISRSVYVITNATPDGKIVTLDPKIKDGPVTILKVSGDVLSESDYKSHVSSVQNQSTVYKNISASDLKTRLSNKDFFLLDVHIPEQEHIASTDAFIPYDDIESNISKLPTDKSKPIVVYCRSGSMSQTASQTLIDLGYTDVTNMLGGINAFNEL